MDITKVTITINGAIEKIWELLMDPENMKHWLTGFISAEPESGKAGEPGSVSKLRFKEGGRIIEVIETVLDCKPNQLYIIAMKHKKFENETAIRLISLGSRTEMIQTVQFFPKSFLLRVLTPLMKGQMKKRMAKELHSFKKFAEAKLSPVYETK